MGWAVVVGSEGCRGLGQALLVGLQRGSRQILEQHQWCWDLQHLPVPQRSAPHPAKGNFCPKVFGVCKLAADTRSAHCHGAAPALTPAFLTSSQAQQGLELRFVPKQGQGG